MSVTVKTPARPMFRAHWAALVITVLSVMLVASLSLLAVRLLTGSPPSSSVSVINPQPIDNGCQLARPGRPC